jgi:thiamine-phosphate pyrophosphorylase
VAQALPPPAFPPLHAIVDVDVCRSAGWAPLDLARALLDGGARLIQLRAKTMDSGPFLELADAAVRLATEAGGRIIVNDRVDIARLSNAAGVHVGQEDLPPVAAREQLGPDAIVGYSTHSVPQIEEALRQPLSYLAVGPIFGTRTKDTGYSAVGLELVAAAVRLAGGLPVVAIGGITLDNARSVLDAGAASVAVISDLLATGDPADRTRSYLQVSC